MKGHGLLSLLLCVACNGQITATGPDAAADAPQADARTDDGAAPPDGAVTDASADGDAAGPDAPPDDAAARDATAIDAAAQDATVIDADPREVVYLPSSLTGDNPTNPSQGLELFLNDCSHKRVIFPSGKTFVLERQLVIHDVVDCDIDFNGSTLQLPDNVAWASRYDTGQSVGQNAVTVHDSTNLTFHNYVIDGNSAHVSADEWCIGLWLENSPSFTSVGGSFKNCNYHQLVIYPGTPGARFTSTYFKDHGGASSPAGISDVFVSNDPTDDFSFVGVTVDNTALRDRQAQLFYIAGYNGYFEDVVTNNCSSPLDVRFGTHVARDFTVTNAALVLMLQPYPGGNGGAGYARVTASNFVGRSIKGSAQGATGLYILASDYANLDNFDIEMDTTSSYSWFGVRVRKYYPDMPINGVVMSNIKVTGFSLWGMYLDGLDTSTTSTGVTMIGDTTATTKYGIRTENCTADQFVENLTTTNCEPYSSLDGHLVVQ